MQTKYSMNKYRQTQAIEYWQKMCLDVKNVKWLEHIWCTKLGIMCVRNTQRD